MIRKIQEEILSNLPAWEAQKKMAPPIRRPLASMPTSVKKSAVCVLLFYKKNELYTILIERTHDGKTHGGQISFPGGRLDDNDFSYTYCAQRECEEEINLPKHKIEVLGTMSFLYIPPSNFLVSPIICFCPSVKNLTPSPTEVETIIEVPLSQLFDSKAKKTKKVWPSNKPDQTMETPTYSYQGYTIWGATAMMLSEFEEIYNRVK